MNRHETLAVFEKTWGGVPPWPCYFCGEPVTEQAHSGPRVLNRHHVDGDSANNSPENIVPSHRECHWDWHIDPYEVTPFTANQRGVVV